MDPYVVIDYLNEKYKTPTIDEGGKNPEWNKVYMLDVFDNEEHIKFDVMDEDPGIDNDDIIGFREMNIKTLLESKNKWYNLYYDKKMAG